MSLIFVYGTLKRGGSNHHYLTGQKFLGAARTVPGFRLFELGGFPGLVPVPEDKAGVIGEVYDADATAVAKLDVLEGLAEGMYRRETVKLQAPFADQAIETYIYSRSVENRRDLGALWHVERHRRGN
jgi:gamma-glutamylcyclotransferase (GGCT)/AIG2-like uncharacterized protein YtfP